VAIGHVAEMFERLYGQAVGLVDDDEGAAMRAASWVISSCEPPATVSGHSPA
jgi:hypothetical protein